MTKPVAQMIIFRYNTRRNAYVGDRDGFEMRDVFDIKLLKQEVNKILDQLQHAGYVLVKYAGRMFLCEKNNVEPDREYIRHEINYHPLDRYFSV